MAVSGASGGKSDSIRAGRAFVELTANDAGLRKGLERARLAVMNFGKSIAVGGAGLVGIGTTILAPLATAFKGVMDKGSDIQRLGTKLGVPAKQLSEFAYAAETTGMSFEDLTGQFENLAERVAQGAEGTGEAAETFKKLGIDANALKMQNPVDQMLTLAEAMGNVANETERLGMLSSLGGDQFQWMNNLFKQGPEGIKKLMQEAKDVGASMSDDTAANASKASAAFTKAWTGIKNSVMSVGAVFLDHADIIKEASDWFVGVAKGVRNFISENKTLVLSIAGVGAGLFAAGVAFVGIGSALAMGATALGGFMAALSAVGSALAAVFSPVGIGVAAVTALAVGIGFVVREMVLANAEGQKFADGFLGMLGSIAGQAKTSMKAIGSALATGDLKTAWEVGLLGLRSVWDQTFVLLQAGWNTFKATFVDEWHKVIRDIEILWEGLSGQIQSVFFDVLISLRSKFAETFKTIFSMAAAAANVLGDKKLGQAFESIGGADTGTLQLAKREAEKAHIERMKQIEREFELDQQLRNKSRAQALEEAGIKAAASKKALDDKMKEIELGKLAIGVFAATWQALHPEMAKQIDGAKAQLAGSSVKGLFQAPNLNQALGYGDNTKLLEVNKNMAKKLGVIAEAAKKGTMFVFK